MPLADNNFYKNATYFFSSIYFLLSCAQKRKWTVFFSVWLIFSDQHIHICAYAHTGRVFQINLKVISDEHVGGYTHSGNTISTPMPAIILRIRIVVWMPAFCFEITMPLYTDSLRRFSGTSCKQKKWMRLMFVLVGEHEVINIVKVIL